MIGRLAVAYLNIQTGFVLNPNYLFLDVLKEIFNIIFIFRYRDNKYSDDTGK